jgi:hypothetical protein
LKKEIRNPQSAIKYSAINRLVILFPQPDLSKIEAIAFASRATICANMHHRNHRKSRIAIRYCLRFLSIDDVPTGLVGFSND